MKTSKTRRNERRTMAIESMEDRKLFAADLMGHAELIGTAQVAQLNPANFQILSAANITINDGTVHVNGTEDTDIVTIEDVQPLTIGTSFIQSSNTSLSRSSIQQTPVVQLQASLPKIRVTVKDGGGDVVKQKTYIRSEVDTVSVSVMGGNDQVTNTTSVPTVIYGGSGNDTLRGGSSADTIHGHDGVDRIYGNGGNDTLVGGNDTDHIYGGDGNDAMYGQDGNDNLYGQNGYLLNDSLGLRFGWIRLVMVARMLG